MPLEVGLELVDLGKRYGETVALDGLSLTVEPGVMHGFVGPNGSGKTTAMRIAIGVLEADRGEVLWDGRPSGLDERRRIGYMPEERGLYPKMKVIDHLIYLAALHGLDRTVARRHAGDWLDRLGLAKRSSDKVEELSLGNQQRVQLAASLVFEPELLILDEPFSGLDPIGVDVLSEALLSVCEDDGVPVLFSSHQLELVERLCREVTIIKAGSMVASGPVDRLRQERSGDLWRLVLDRSDSRRNRGLDEPPRGFVHIGDGIYRREEGADPDRLLECGMAEGRVRAFGPVETSLAELFRETVAGEVTE